jgi:hypothetical protein
VGDDHEGELPDDEDPESQLGEEDEPDDCSRLATVANRAVSVELGPLSAAEEVVGCDAAGDCAARPVVDGDGEPTLRTITSDVLDKMVVLSSLDTALSSNSTVASSKAPQGRGSHSAPIPRPGGREWLQEHDDHDVIASKWNQKELNPRL